MKRYYQYVDDVESGRVVACDATKRAVERFRADLAAAKKRGGRWRFDEDRADKIITFIEHLVQFEEPFAGQPIHLEPWECFFLGQLYGWRDKATGRRRFKKAMLFMGRKQGKTILASSLALYEILSKPGIEAYSLATKQIIANKSFKNLAMFIKANPRIAQMLQIYKSPHTVVNPHNASTFTPLSRDSDLDGLNPAYCIIDELAAQADGVAYNALTSGMGTRSEPLVVIISTASATLNNPLIEEYNYAKKILDGTIQDESFLVSIYEYDKDDRWDDLSVMQKAAPNLGVSVQLDYYADELKKAKVIPLKALEYKTKYCNLWQSSNDTWIPDALWARCRRAAERHAKAVTPEALAAAPCFIAIDASTIWDWTAMSRYYYLAEIDKFVAKHRFYIPGDKVEEKRNIETPSLDEWIRLGLVTATPGEKIDQAFLYRDLEEDMAQNKVVAVVYDPARLQEFEKEFSDRYPIAPFRQNVANMSPAAKMWEESIVGGQIIDDSPVMRWMVSCAINKQYADSGRYQITKHGSGKYGKRIDGVISSIMAHAALKSHVIELKKPKPKIFDLSRINY
jgi:phage terminase large subunit-like protein